MIKFRTVLFATLAFFSISLKMNAMGQTISDEVKITWTENLTGDFSFIKNWDYPEGVYVNQHGQLSCDGLCPVEVDNMKDENGRLYDDSLASFYQLVDTSHFYYSLESEAWCYEWGGTDYVTAQRKGNDSVHCYSHNTIGTHSSLNLMITKDTVIPTIRLTSVVMPGVMTYRCISGNMQIDQNMWYKGVLKASFDFKFDHVENPQKSMYWKGKIYTKILN